MDGIYFPASLGHFLGTYEVRYLKEWQSGKKNSDTCFILQNLHKFGKILNINCLWTEQIYLRSLNKKAKFLKY